MRPKRQCTLSIHFTQQKCAQSNHHHHFFSNHWMKSFIHFGKKILNLCFYDNIPPHFLFISMLIHFQNGSFFLSFQMLKIVRILSLCFVVVVGVLGKLIINLKMQFTCRRPFYYDFELCLRWKVLQSIEIKMPPTSKFFDKIERAAMTATAEGLVSFVK